jgi:hypothetical protein
VTALACGHRMCRPGSDECKARDALAAELLSAGIRTTSDVRAALGGRPLYVQPAAPAAIPVELLPRLLADILADARQQLDNVNGTAALLHWGRPELATQAVANWHHNNPGLSRLLDLTDPKTTEGS